MAWVEIGVASLCVLTYIIFTDDVGFETDLLDSKNIGLLLILGWVATSFPFIASIGIMRQISPFVCAMAINLEPLYTIVIALFLYGDSEFMSSGFYLGGLLILITTFVGPLWSKSK
jgi:drug/metabolite transporter (DMT)-like permease